MADAGQVGLYAEDGWRETPGRGAFRGFCSELAQALPGNKNSE